MEDGAGYVLRGSIRDFAIPSTLQDSLIARLDRLGPAKDIALTASVVGRDFTYELLEAVAAVPQATLLEGLDRLVQSDLLGQTRHRRRARATPSSTRSFAMPPFNPS